MFKQLSREPFLIWADGESNRSYVRHPYIEVLSRWRWSPTFQPNSYFSQMELFITQSVPKTNSPNSSNSYTTERRSHKISMKRKKKPNFPKFMRLRFFQPILISFPEKKIYFYKKKKTLHKFSNARNIDVASFHAWKIHGEYLESYGISREVTFVV